MRLHHAQVAIPDGGEADGRRFWVAGVGMAEVEKPTALRDRGGLRVLHPGGAEVHLGVAEPFTPARTAHPAFVLASVARFDEVAVRLELLGYDIEHGQRVSGAPPPPRVRRPRQPGSCSRRSWR